MVSVNATFFVQLLLFLILVFILNGLLFKPIMGVIRQREEKLQKTRDEIREIQRKIQLLLAQRQEQEAQTIRAANQKREELRQAAQREAEEKQSALKLELEKRKKAMEAEVEKAIQVEMTRLEQYAKLLAKELIAKITKKRGVLNHA